MDGEDSLQISRVAANILNHKFREAEEIGPKRRKRRNSRESYTGPGCVSEGIMRVKQFVNRELNIAVTAHYYLRVIH